MLAKKNSPLEWIKCILPNKNFTRVIDLDTSSIYKAINSNFGQNTDWEKNALNIYSIFDFYSESLKELREKYQSQINFKVEEQKN